MSARDGIAPPQPSSATSDLEAIRCRRWAQVVAAAIAAQWRSMFSVRLSRQIRSGMRLSVRQAGQIMPPRCNRRALLCVPPDSLCVAVLLTSLASQVEAEFMYHAAFRQRGEAPNPNPVLPRGGSFGDGLRCVGGECWWWQPDFFTWGPDVTPSTQFQCTVPDFQDLSFCHQVT